MREYNVLISHVEKDKDKALFLAEHINNASFEFQGEYIKMNAVYMESAQNGCFGDFLVWSENAVLSSDCVLAIISPSTAVKTDEVNGADVNYKIVYDEVSLAKETSKDIMLVKDSSITELEPGYRILFQNISAEYYTDNLTDNTIASILNKIFSFAKARLSGNPILAYAGKNEATLAEYAIGDSKIFLGRIPELETMDCLFNRHNTICISGFGGIGKTTLAKMYAIKHPELALSVYYCTEEATLKNVITKLISDNVEQVSLDKYEQQPLLKYNEEYRRAITHLSKIHKPTLIIIDNFNFDFTGKDNNRVFDDISTLTDCKFIITTRNANIQRQDIGIIDVEKMDDNSLFELFYRDSYLQRSEENDRIISKLIEITEGHTMTIELVARAIGNDVSGLTPSEILDTMLDENNSAETRLEDNARFDDFGEYDTIYNYLNKLFALTRLTEPQKQLLGCLSFIPTDGLSARDIKMLVKELSADELRYLVRLGYIQTTEHTPYSYYLHPLISELSFRKFADRFNKNLQVTLFVIYNKLEPISKNPESNQADLKCAYRYASFLTERLENLIEKGEIASLLYKDKLLLVNEYIAHIHYCLFNLEDAMNYYKKVANDAQDLIDHLPDKLKYQETMLRNAINYARLCIILGKKTEADFQFDQSIDITERILKELTDNPISTTGSKRGDIAKCYVDLGYLYRQLGNLAKACEYYNKSIEIYARLGWDENVANIETILGYIQIDMGDFSNAEITFKGALSRTKGIIERSNNPIQAKIMHAKSAIDLASLYTKVDRKSMALMWFEYALNRLTELYQKSPTIRVKRELINAQTNVADIHVDSRKPRVALKELKIAVDMALEVYNETNLERDLDTLNECLVKYEWTRCLCGGLIARFINGCRIVSSKRLYAYKIYQNIDADYDKYCLKVYERLAYASTNPRIKSILLYARDDTAEKIAQKEKQNKKQ